MYDIVNGSWPLGVALLVLLVTALCELRFRRIPNEIVLSLLALGWLVAALATWGPIEAGGSFLGSLASTFIALLMLLKSYEDGLGAGCVKSQMAMGAWVGCATGLVAGMLVTSFAVLAGDVCTRLAVRSRLGSCLYQSQRLNADSQATLLYSAQATHSFGAAAVLIGCMVSGAL